MKIVRTNLPPPVAVLLVLLAVAFVVILAVFIIPVLIIIGFCWLVFSAVTGTSPADPFRRWKERHRKRFYEGPQEAEPPRGRSASRDDTIECEVISARTLDENGQEIR